MTAPYSPGYNPYSSNELDDLERQRQLLSGNAPPPAALATDPMSGIGYDQTTAAEQPAIPAPEPAPPPQPLDLHSAPAALRKGMGVSKVETTGIPDAERSRLEAAHAELTGQKLGQIQQSTDTERGIESRGLGVANARSIEAANQEVYAKRALEDSQRKQAELRKAQDEWSQKKEDGSALKAFGGNELAMVLSGIGMAAGTFSQAMGWQNGNPIKDMFDKTIDRSIAAQREQKNSRLNVLAARLGDEKAAELQVRGELHEATATRIQAQMQGTQHQDALDRLGPLAQDQAIKAKEAQLAASEALVPKQSVTQTPLKAAGGAESSKKLKEALELDALLEKQGRTPEQRQAVLKSAGMSLPDKGMLTAAEQTNAEQASKKDKPTEAESKKQNAIDSLTNLRKQMLSLPERVHSRESEILPVRAARGAADYAFGKGAGDVTLSKKELADSQAFEQAKTNYTALLSQSLGQGALAGPEYERSIAAAQAIDSPRKLAAALDNTLRMLGQKPQLPSNAEPIP